MKMDQPDLAGLALDPDDDAARQEKVKIGDLVHKYLEAQALGMLPEQFMQHAVENFVEKGDKGSITTMVSKLLKQGRKGLDDLEFVPSREGFEYDNLEEEMQQVKLTTGKKFTQVSRWQRCIRLFVRC